MYSPSSSVKGCVRSMLKIAVLGARETVMGFKALGLDAYPVENPDEARIRLRELTRSEEGEDRYAIIYIEEGIAESLSVEIARYKDMPIPALILIPGREGPLGLGQSALLAAVERAVGSNIL